MFKYLLKCKDCKQEFESWFSTSSEYDRLLKLKLLNCQSCESINVEKSLMSPNLLNTKKKENLKEIKKFKEVRKKLSDYNIQNGSIVHILPGKRPLTARPGISESRNLEIDATNIALEQSITGEESPIQSTESIPFHKLPLCERWKYNEIISTNMYLDRDVEGQVGQNEIMDSIERRNMFGKYTCHIKAEYKRGQRERNQKVINLYNAKVIGKNLGNQTWKEAKDLKEEIEQAWL